MGCVHSGAVYGGFFILDWKIIRLSPIPCSRHRTDLSLPSKRSCSGPLLETSNKEFFGGSKDEQSLCNRSLTPLHRGVGGKSFFGISSLARFWPLAFDIGPIVTSARYALEHLRHPLHHRLQLPTPCLPVHGLGLCAHRRFPAWYPQSHASMVKTMSMQCVIFTGENSHSLIAC